MDVRKWLSRNGVDYPETGFVVRSSAGQVNDGKPFESYQDAERVAGELTALGLKAKIVRA